MNPKLEKKQMKVWVVSMTRIVQQDFEIAVRLPFEVMEPDVCDSVAALLSDLKHSFMPDAESVKSVEAGECEIQYEVQIEDIERAANPLIEWSPYIEERKEDK